MNHPVKELIWVLRNETKQASGNAGGRNQSFDTDETTDYGDWSASTVSIDDFKGQFLLKLNGHDRFAPRVGQYFTRTQVYQHHTGCGGTPSIIAGKNATLTGVDPERQLGMSIGVYSFALKPEDHQPSGSCNFSRIDNTVLEIEDLQIYTVAGQDDSTVGQGDNAIIDVGTTNKSTNVKLMVFAVNYNVLRIMSGMGGLAYSN